MRSDKSTVILNRVLWRRTAKRALEVSPVPLHFRIEIFPGYGVVLFVCLNNNHRINPVVKDQQYF